MTGFFVVCTSCMKRMRKKLVTYNGLYQNPPSSPKLERVGLQHQSFNLPTFQSCRSLQDLEDPRIEGCRDRFRDPRIEAPRISLQGTKVLRFYRGGLGSQGWRRAGRLGKRRKTSSQSSSLQDPMIPRISIEIHLFHMSPKFFSFCPLPSPKAGT